jgi:uncharacterized protein (TIGR02271 family)
MTNAQTPDTYLGRSVVDPEGNKIGSVGQVYVNDESGVPDWITVNTGLFGMKENFVPLQGSSVTGDDLVVPFGKDVVKDAPHVDDASHLDPDEQQSLYTYYQQYLTGGTAGRTQTVDSSVDTSSSYDTPTGYATATDYDTAGAVGTADTSTTSNRTTGYDTAGAVGTADTTTTSDRTAGYDTSGPTTDDAMTRSEEHLNVGTQRVEAGRARLRQYVVTEQQTVTVPVTREEVRIEREPITEANRGEALSGPDISEEEHEVVLHAEQPVVTTEAVPVERVRLGTETVTEQQTVSGEVRKEQIEVDGGVETSGTATGTTETGTYSDNR